MPEIIQGHGSQIVERFPRKCAAVTRRWGADEPGTSGRAERTPSPEGSGNCDRSAFSTPMHEFLSHSLRPTNDAAASLYALKSSTPSWSVLEPSSHTRAGFPQVGSSGLFRRLHSLSTSSLASSSAVIYSILQVHISRFVSQKVFLLASIQILPVANLLKSLLSPFLTDSINHRCKTIDLITKTCFLIEEGQR